ncbi:hypothetical protein, partial [Limosilactobacillus reuteri]|uniref:hypothetical protein n=1 Tax=Limosilactobacillus reuteri TaxID=1598 RepID=UPI00207D60A1
STVTLADVTGVQFPVVANKKYWFRFHITYSSAAVATGANFCINGPTLTTAAYKTIIPQAATTDVTRNLSSYNSGIATTGSVFTTAGNTAT